MSGQLDLPWEQVTKRVVPRRRVTLNELCEHAAQLAVLADRYGVRSIRVFGSVARGEADEASDLDLLVEVEPGVHLVDLAEFALDVEALLGVHTQVVTVGGLKPRIRQRVLDEAVLL